MMQQRCLIAVLLLMAVANTTMASGKVDSWIYGSLPADTLEPDISFSVVAFNPSLGIERQVAVSAQGHFRISSLPPGPYRLLLQRDAQLVDQLALELSAGVGQKVHFVPPRAGWSPVVVLDNVVVESNGITPLDYSQTGSVAVFNEELIDSLPTGRTLTDIALLTPGTVAGDSAFNADGPVASIAGSSVAENIYYINGFNISNFRTGVGFTQVPFEFLEQVQVNSGGYGAEFGRSTGGAISSHSKRGSQQWDFGINSLFEPGGLRAHQPDVYRRDGQLLVNNSSAVVDQREINIWARGPLVEDRLVMYGLLNLRQVSSSSEGFSRAGKNRSDDPFYGLKLDWQIAAGHSLEFTALSDKRSNVQQAINNNPDSANFGELIGTQQQRRGGRNLIARYSAQLGNLSLSALAGQGQMDLSDVGDRDDCPVAGDQRGGGFDSIGCWVGSGFIAKAKDERNAYRLDGEWPIFDAWGEHVLRFGADFEDNRASDQFSYSGGSYYLYVNTEPGSQLSDGTVPDDVNEAVRQIIYQTGGRFTTRNRAWYIEDSWSPNEQLLLYLGLRSESFENRNALGQGFIKISNQLAPRLGASWDAFGHGRSRLFASLGRYHLPVATNTNVKMAGGELFTDAYYQCGPDGAAQACEYDPFDARPLNQGSQIGSTQIFADGSVPDVREILDQSIKPMHQDELILGFQSQLGNDWSAGLRFIHRDLGRSIEDVVINQALLRHAQNNGLSTERLEDPAEPPHYVLTNPGTSIRTFYDFEGDGELESVTLTRDELGFPKARRKYNAVELFTERRLHNAWFFQGSYTWSQSYGNSEGYVLSDNGQDDAGITIQFDHPALLEGAKGYLPNDRRHQIKMYGSWAPQPNWQLGLNLRVQSGRPVNAFGVHPTDPDAATYGAVAFYQDGVLAPRGSRGRTPWTGQLDLALKYYNAVIPGLTVSLDIFNVLGADQITEVDEEAEQDSGSPNASYGLARSFQPPRSVRFGLHWAFRNI